MTRTRANAAALAVSILLMAGVLPAASSAAGPILRPAATYPASTAQTPLHRLANGVDGLTSDGSRYVAWTTANRLTVYDAETGRRRHVAMPVAPCGPRVIAMHGGEALVECYPSPQVVVNLATGATNVLGPPWITDNRATSIGSRWIQAHQFCSDTDLMHPQYCDTLLDRQTGAMHEQPGQEFTPLDLDAADPQPVVRCSPTHGRFTTPSYDGRNYLYYGYNYRLILGRCGGRSKTLWPEFAINGHAIGGGVASWLPTNGVAYAYILATGRTYRWRLGGTALAVAHTRTSIFIAREVTVDRAGDYTATLFTARLPSSKKG